MKSAASKIDTDQLRVAVRKVLAYKPPPESDSQNQTTKPQVKQRQDSQRKKPVDNSKSS